MNSFAKEIIPVNLEDELKNSYLSYAMSVIVARALPDVRDGLKPVHRRILFAMYQLGNTYDKPYKKSARIVGDVIGKYHPHGDAAVYDTIVRMAQSFSLRYMLIDGQGNFGSIDGDSAAAMRYTEIRMSKIAYELLSDLEKNTVDFIPNYDNSELIPEILPTQIPNLLINGTSGIAVGMATNIPPHNLTEIINGCLAYIKNDKITIKELMEFIPGPDFPTFGVINGIQGIEEAYLTGRGKIFIRAVSNIKIDNKIKRNVIVISELPYQVNKARLIEKIAELVKEKRIEGISALRDESDQDGMRIVIEVKKDSQATVVLNNLYSLTQLQISFSMNMVALNHGKPITMNLKEILEHFVNHRREVVTRRTVFDLQKAKCRIHIIEGLIISLENIDSIISIIRYQLTSLEAKKQLLTQVWNVGNFNKIIKKYELSASDLSNYSKLFAIKNDKYYFTDLQAQSILEMRLNKLTGLENKKLLSEYEALLKQIIYLVKVLKDPDKLMNIIYKELKLIRDKFGDVRRTTINNNNLNIENEQLVHHENVVVTLSHQGYVKYQPLTDYEAQRRGGKGKSAANIKEEDFIDSLLVANTHDTILCFSSKGRLYWLKVYQLPEASRVSRGRPIVNLLPLAAKERITTILPVPKYEEGLNVLMSTAKGRVKKTALCEFSRPRNIGIIAINLCTDDELIGVALTNGSNEIMLFSSHGKVVRFSETNVRKMGRTASGVCGIKLTKDDRVVSLIVPNKNGTILTVTQNGYGKRTSNSQYPTKSRATQGVISIKVTKRNGLVVGAVQVLNSDQIMIITNAGTLVRTRVSEVSVVGRNTQGVILIRIAENESVVGLQRVADSVID